jgi:4-hydroxybenzoate polyprenyltransferase
MLARIRIYASFVRVSHSVFALPFALVGALLASRIAPLTWARAGWIVACMVLARSAAMGFNRLADAAYDARNPRTAMRELPRGRLSRAEAVAFVVIASVLFVFCTAQLNPLCLALSPVALAIVFWYSLAKRFTAYTQLFLGLAMAVAPVGGWLAVGARGGWEPWLLAVAIGTWVGGFDVLYACQDLDIDRREGLQSIPVRFGVGRALRISRTMHLVTIATLVLLGVAAALGPVYFAGVVGVALLLGWEQSLVRSDDLTQIKRAFDMNGWVGLLYLATTAVAIYWK